MMTQKQALECPLEFLHEKEHAYSFKPSAVQLPSSAVNSLLFS